MRKTPYFLLAIFFSSITLLHAQTKNQVDSLLQLIPQSKQDSTLSNLYLKISKGYNKTGDFENSQNYSEKSFLHSKKINFYDGMVRAKIQSAKLETDQGKYEKAKSYLNDGLAIRQQIKDTQGIIILLLKLGSIENSLSNFDKAIEQYNLAAQLAIKLHDSLYIARAYNNTGIVYQGVAKHTEAISFFLKSLKISEKINDHLARAMTLSSIGYTYTMLNNGEEALPYLRSSLAVSTQHNLQDARISALTNMQRAFDRTGQLDSLLHYNKVSLEIVKKRNEPIFTARADNNMADAFSRLNQLDSALFYISEAVELSRQTENKGDVGVMLGTKGEILIKLAKKTGRVKFYHEALADLKEAIIISGELNDLDNLKDCYRLISQAYSGLNKFEEAYTYHEKYSQLKDSINNSVFTGQIVEMNAKYETEKKDHAIAQGKVLMTQKEIELTKKSNDNKMLLAGVAVLFVVLIFGSITFVQRQKLAKRQKEFEKHAAIEQTRAAIAGDLHDDIGSTLSSVQFMSSFAIQAIDNSSSDARQWVQKIENNTADLLQNIRDIVWTLNPENDNAADIILRMKHFASQILEPKNITFAFHITEEAEKYLDTLIAKRNVFLIYKEVLNNAAKYSETKEINVMLAMEGDKMKMTITDNGKGFDQQSLSSGSGLKNIKKRAEHLNGKLNINSSGQSGTSVELIC